MIKLNIIIHEYYGKRLVQLMHMKSLDLRTFWSKMKAHFTLQVSIFKSTYSDDSSITDVGESKMQAYMNFK